MAAVVSSCSECGINYPRYSKSRTTCSRSCEEKYKNKVANAKWFQEKKKPTNKAEGIKWSGGLGRGERYY